MTHNNPYEIKTGEHYIPSMNALNRIYSQHPDFKPATKLIYELLFDYWNPKYGYAFPTMRQLERDSGLGYSTVEQQIRTLIKLNLIEKERSAKHGNNVYYVKKPVNSLEQLYEKFPDIRDKSEERLQKIKDDEVAEKERRNENQTSNQNNQDDPNDFDPSWF
ncbi:helix-turn-helix domain-containing protein [Alkalibacillus sp. S2W]|uniref:helix-turn-helix domain-containing protein n=1 Tax=Alkalibacillus sp. S2W TaxID=3386553 RepID=UPI00398CC936